MTLFVWNAHLVAPSPEHRSGDHRVPWGGRQGMSPLASAPQPLLVWPWKGTHPWGWDLLSVCWFVLPLGTWHRLHPVGGQDRLPPWCRGQGWRGLGQGNSPCSEHLYVDVLGTRSVALCTFASDCLLGPKVGHASQCGTLVSVEQGWGLGGGRPPRGLPETLHQGASAHAWRLG